MAGNESSGVKRITMKESVKHLIATITTDTGAYMQTIQHKFLTYAGGTSAIYQLRDTLHDWLPSWIVDPIYFIFSLIAEIPWMDMLSGIAVFLLVIERFFIAIGKYMDWQERRREKKKAE